MKCHHGYYAWKEVCPYGCDDIPGPSCTSLRSRLALAEKVVEAAVMEVSGVKMSIRPQSLRSAIAAYVSSAEDTKPPPTDLGAKKV